MGNLQRGNILFLILLAVVLFAALAYAVTSSMRGGGKDASSENYEAAAGDILSFMSAARNATDRMLLMGPYKAEQLSFKHPYKQYDGAVNDNIDHNPNCTVNACQVFNAEGGGVEGRTFEKYAVKDPTGILPANTMPGHYNIVMMNVPYAGTSANDVILGINAIKPQICDIIDARLNLPKGLGQSGTFIRAKDTSQWDNAAYTITGDTSGLVGKDIHTRRGGTGLGENCSINQVLIAR